MRDGDELPLATAADAREQLVCLWSLPNAYSTAMPNSRTTSEYEDKLWELSQHYDTLFWGVSSLWTAAIGGLLAYCFEAGEKLDPWLAVLGIGLTLWSMYFAVSFRLLRRQAIDLIPENVQPLHTGIPGFRQWNPFAVVFGTLVLLWFRLLFETEPDGAPLWTTLGVFAIGLLVWLWMAGLPPEKEPGWLGQTIWIVVTLIAWVLFCEWNHGPFELWQWLVTVGAVIAVNALIWVWRARSLSARATVAEKLIERPT